VEICADSAGYAPQALVPLYNVKFRQSLEHQALSETFVSSTRILFSAFIVACGLLSRGEPLAPSKRGCLWASEAPSKRGCCVGNRSARLEWWSQTGSNRRHRACKARALPAELWPQLGRDRVRSIGTPTSSLRMQARLVGLGRFELPTSRLSSARSNQLSYRP
jgi:hypothetical protein